MDNNSTKDGLSTAEPEQEYNFVASLKSSPLLLLGVVLLMILGGLILYLSLASIPQNGQTIKFQNYFISSGFHAL